MSSEHDNKPRQGEAATTKVLGKEHLRPVLPKRFYKTASVQEHTGSFRITLDGRPVKTPGKRELALPTLELAEAIAAEWAAQGERIDPEAMPLTKIANTSIDAVSMELAAVAADIQAYAGNDLLCYRATDPDGLVKRQHANWEPLLAWAKTELGASFEVTKGVMPVTQPAAAIEAIGRAIQSLNAFQMACLHVMTTLTGSALLAIAHARGRLTADQAWSAAHVDECWQVEHWGSDAEAEEREAKRRAEFHAASRFLALLGRSC